MKIKSQKKTRAQLEREIVELKSQMAHAYHYARAELEKATKDHFMASGLIVEITRIGGTPLINPICIKDGLSDETITALKADIIRSYEQTVHLKP